MCVCVLGQYHTLVTYGRAGVRAPPPTHTHTRVRTGAAEHTRTHARAAGCLQHTPCARVCVCVCDCGDTARIWNRTGLGASVCVSAALRPAYSGLEFYRSVRVGVRACELRDCLRAPVVVWEPGVAFVVVVVVVGTQTRLPVRISVYLCHTDFINPCFLRSTCG